MGYEAGCVGESNAPDMVFGRFNEPYKMPKPGENRKTIWREGAPLDGLPFDPKK